MRLIIIPMLISSAWGAIAFDTSNGACRSASGAFTCPYTLGAGTNEIIHVSTFLAGNGVGYIDSMVWDVSGANQAFTKLTDFSYNNSGSFGTMSVWILVGPTTTGAKNISLGTGGGGGGVQLELVIRSYTGVKQTGQPEANSGNLTPTCGNTNCNAPITTVANNAWIVLSLTNVLVRPMQCNQSGDNCTNLQVNTVTFSSGSADLGPNSPAGSYTITANASGAGTSVMGLYAISLAPAATTVVKHKVTIE